MKTNILAAILGLGFIITGVFAFTNSQAFFNLLGEYYGIFNNHFVKDAGIAFFSAGFLILLSTKVQKWSVPLTLGGALFIILHGIFHIQMLLMGMIPTTLDMIKEVLLIVSPSALTALLLILRVRAQSQESNY